MRLGLIARSDNRGLSQQCWEYFRHLRPAKTLVANIPSIQPLPRLYPERYPGATIIDGWPTMRDCHDFLQDLDVVLSAELFYWDELPNLARSMGVKTVLVPNYELFDRNVPRPDLIAAPTMWHYNDLPDPKTLLRVPIATDRFEHRPLTRLPAMRFLHCVGRPATRDRNGTVDLLKALRWVKSTVTVTVRCQLPGHVENLIGQHCVRVPENVTLVLESGDVDNYWENFRGHDVLVMPRRYAGLCLPAQEALGAGLPVVMPAVSPNEWLPAEWLVPAHHAGEFNAKALIDLYSVNHRDLAERIDQFATDGEFYLKARDEARRLAEGLSWDVWLPKYEALFQSLLG